MAGAAGRIRKAWAEAGPGLDRWLIRLIVFGIFLRFILLWTTFGSNDTRYWGNFADSVLARGLIGAYQEHEFLNYPPLATMMVTGLRWIAETSGAWFPALLRLPAVIADLVAIGLLYRYWLPKGRRMALTVAAAYALAPIVILSSAYHGNTDTIYAVALLASVILLSKDRGLAAGLVFAFAINIKLVPLIVGPALLVAAWQRKQHIAFLAGSATGLIGFAPLVLTKPGLLVTNIVGYLPNPTQWGLSGLSSVFPDVVTLAELASIIENNVRIVLLVVTIGGLIICIMRGQRDPVRLAVWPTMAFLAYTPTVAPQHIIIAAGLIFAADIGWAVGWTLATSAYAIAVYLFHLDPVLRPFVSAFYGAVDAWVVGLGFVALITSAIAGWQVSMTVAPDDGSRELDEVNANR
ncbi:MAG: DUF2029 domain-containing protein [Acidimicrobiia bacterium]|nr:DUF2029 domain-containing protein [Acidimicrobiia bacterium]